MLRESVAKFARERIHPLVREMDEKSHLNPDLLKELFAQGLMGIETDPELGGSGMGFMSSIIAIEELAKVDPAISVIVDVQVYCLQCAQLTIEYIGQQFRSFVGYSDTKDGVLVAFGHRHRRQLLLERGV